MKFIVSSGNLLKNLQSISGVISANPVLSIIENFHFAIKDEKLKITATDLETTMSVVVDVQSNENATICLEAKLLMDYLKNISEQPLTFDINTTDFAIEITSDEGKYKLVGEDADQYPKEPTADDANEFGIRSSQLVSAIANTVFAVSNDDLRPAMTGVYFEMDPNFITFVATDAHRLVRYTLADVKCPTTQGIIVPKKPLSQLKNVLPNDDTQVQLSYNNSHLFVKNEKVSLCCRLIDAKFPDYKVVVPTNNPYLMTVNRSEFLSGLRRVAVFANKTTNQLVLRIAGSELRLHSQDVDFSHEGNERMACQFQGEDMDIAFNAKLLLELVNTLSCEEVAMELSTSSRAGILKPHEKTEGEDLIMLLMPLMLNN